MKMRPLNLVVVLWLAALAGCASVTFKRGASADAMADDERACRAATTSDADYAECMRSRGSYVAGRSAASKETKAEVAEPKTPVVAPAATPGAAATSEEPQPLPAVTPPPSAATPLAAKPSPTPAAAVPADPLARVEVASWWKLGGSPAELQAAIDTCVTQLGPAHRPDPGATVVTAGLRACLHAAGWYAFGK
jgi:hypothetical protein